MKRIVYYLAAVLCLAGMAACQEKTPDPETENPPVTDDLGNTWVTTECVTPITYAEGGYNAASTGVSIDITANEAHNIKFVCTPGEDIKSYTINVYPLALLYSELDNTRRTGQKETLSTDETEDIIVSNIRSTDNSTVFGGKLMNGTNLGSDFAEYEFDYVNNSNFNLWTIQPGMDYLIVVQACFDENGTDYGDAVVCHVKTPDMSVTGNPQIGIVVTPGMTSYRLTFSPNEDCASFYYFSAQASEIQNYIDLYGEDMFHDFVMSYATAPSDATDPTMLSFSITDQDPNVSHRAAAIALDKNGTPSETVTYQEFDLTTIPEDASQADCEITEFTAVTSCAARFSVEMNESCCYVFYREYPLAEAQAIMNGDDASKDAIALSLSEEAWASTNINFQYDSESGKPTGSGYTDTNAYVSNVGNDDGSSNITPDTEYAILYVGRNIYRQLTELKMSEPFKTKALVRDRPQDSKANGAKIEIPTSDRTSVTVRYIYDPTVTSVLYYQYYNPGWYPENALMAMPESVIPEDPENREAWVYYFIDYRNADPYSSRWGNQVDCIVIPSFQDVKWSGFTAGETYKFAYMAEDYDGVLGYVGECKTTLQSITGGNNPTLAITCEQKSDEKGKYYNFTFTGNDDVRQIRYVIATEGNGAWGSLNADAVMDKDVDYDDAVAYWEEQIISDLASTSSNTTCYNNEFRPNGETIAVALAVGGADEGNPVYSPLQVLIVHEDGTTETLEQFYGMAETVVKYSRSGEYAPKVLKAPASTRVKASEID